VVGFIFCCFLPLSKQIGFIQLSLKNKNFYRLQFIKSWNGIFCSQARRRTFHHFAVRNFVTVVKSWHIFHVILEHRQTAGLVDASESSPCCLSKYDGYLLINTKHVCKLGNENYAMSHVLRRRWFGINWFVLYKKYFFMLESKIPNLFFLFLISTSIIFYGNACTCDQCLHDFTESCSLQLLFVLFVNFCLFCLLEWGENTKAFKNVNKILT